MYGGDRGRDGGPPPGYPHAYNRDVYSGDHRDLGRQEVDGRDVRGRGEEGRRFPDESPRYQGRYEPYSRREGPPRPEYDPRMSMAPQGRRDEMVRGGPSMRGDGGPDRGPPPRTWTPGPPRPLPDHYRGLNHPDMRRGRGGNARGGGGRGGRGGGGGGGGVKADDFFGRALPNKIQGMYKAAGVVLYGRDDEDELCVLLGVETRKKCKGKVLMIFGGKREKDDPDAEFTAIREFHEETLGALGAESHYRLYHQLRHQKLNSKVLYRAGGKYCLFCIPCPTGVDTSVPVSFLTARSELTPDEMVAGSDHPMVQLQWVRWNTVLDAMDTKEKMIDLAAPLETGETTATLYGFAVDLLVGLKRAGRSHGGSVSAALDPPPTAIAPSLRKKEADQLGDDVVVVVGATSEHNDEDEVLAASSTD